MNLIMNVGLAISGSGILADLVLIVVLGIFMIVGTKQGFTKTFFSFIGMLLAAIFAMMVATWIATFLFDNVIRPQLITSFQKNIEESISTQGLQNGITEATGMWSKLLTGSFVDGLLSAIADLEVSLKETAIKLSEGIVDVAIKPFLMATLNLVFFTVLFTFFRWALKLVTRRFDVVNKVPVLGKVNVLFGGVFGLLQGVVTLYVLIFILKIFYQILFQKPVPFADSSFLFRLFYYFNPFS